MASKSKCPTDRKQEPNLSGKLQFNDLRMDSCICVLPYLNSLFQDFRCMQDFLQSSQREVNSTPIKFLARQKALAHFSESLNCNYLSFRLNDCQNIFPFLVHLCHGSIPQSLFAVDQKIFKVSIGSFSEETKQLHSPQKPLHCSCRRTLQRLTKPRCTVSRIGISSTIN